MQFVVSELCDPLSQNEHGVATFTPWNIKFHHGFCLAQLNINILFTSCQLYAHFVVGGHICKNLQRQTKQEISHSTVINLLNIQYDVWAGQHLYSSQSSPCGFTRQARCGWWMQCTHRVLIDLLARLRERAKPVHEGEAHSPLVLLLKQQQVCTLHLHYILIFMKLLWFASF